MLSVYKVISGNLNNAVNEHGEGVLKQPLIKTMRVVKKEILTLFSTWIARAFEIKESRYGDGEVCCFSTRVKINLHVVFLESNCCFGSGCYATCY